jgi:hypothetical protein
MPALVSQGQEAGKAAEEAKKAEEEAARKATEEAAAEEEEKGGWDWGRIGKGILKIAIGVAAVVAVAAIVVATAGLAAPAIAAAGVALSTAAAITTVGTVTTAAVAVGGAALAVGGVGVATYGAFKTAEHADALVNEGASDIELGVKGISEREMRAYNPMRDGVYGGDSGKFYEGMFGYFTFAAMGYGMAELGLAVAVMAQRQNAILAAASVSKGAGSKLFKSQELLDSHYAKHGSQIQKALGESSYSITNYLDDANFIIKNGTYAPELNGYVRFMGGQKYGFVGLDRATGDITTFHIKTVSELIKNAPSLGFGK